MKQHWKTILIALISGFAGSAIFGLLLNKNQQALSLHSGDHRAIQLTRQQGNTSLPSSVDFVNASAVSTPSVVFITTVSTQQRSSFDWYFNWGQPNQVASSGSGVIYSKDGYIITNHHVAGTADKIEVVHEKRTYLAKLVASDPSTDLAVLKIEAENLPAITLGNSRDVQIGEWVLAVGNPFNLTSTVTAGIVSAKARNINVVNSEFPIESFIQTDAAINPGNSGGALVNIQGQLIGINTAILSRTGSYTGYGFAVPVDIVKKVVDDLIKYKEVQKAFFGADVSDLNKDHVTKLKLEQLNGVIVTTVQAEGEAHKAGLKAYDIIVKIESYNIDSKANFDECLSYYNPGDKVKVIYKRGTELKETTVTLTNREGTTSMLRRQTYHSEKLDADFEVISKVEKDKLGTAHGVRIVKPGNGMIGQMGLQQGFIITSINNKSTASAEEVEDILVNVRGRIVIEGFMTNGAKVYYTFYRQ